MHAGSYHLALKDAGIETQNIITYSSILPSIANEIKKPNNLIYGSVMETIMAVGNTTEGNFATAGISYAWLYDKKTNEKYGGIVCEHEGNYSIRDITYKLNASINEIYFNGFSEKYDLKNQKIITNSLKVQKRFGTAIVALCFVDYSIPIIEE